MVCNSQQDIIIISLNMLWEAQRLQTWWRGPIQWVSLADNDQLQVHGNQSGHTPNVNLTRWTLIDTAIQISPTEQFITVGFCCNVVHFNIGDNGDWLPFGVCFRRLLEERQFLGISVSASCFSARGFCPPPGLTGVSSVCGSTYSCDVCSYWCNQGFFSLILAVAN